MLGSALPAQPLDPLQVRLAALRNDQPIRLKVDVELTHRGEVAWQGQPARLLVIRPDPLAAERQDEPKTAGGNPERLVTEARIWLDASGSPLAWNARRSYGSGRLSR